MSTLLMVTLLLHMLAGLLGIIIGIFRRHPLAIMLWYFFFMGTSIVLHQEVQGIAQLLITWTGGT